MSDAMKVSDSDAWALLALREARICKQTAKNMNAWASGDIVRCKTPLEGLVPLARLEGNDFEYTMRKSRVTVGRGSSSESDDVDVKIGHSTLVSRVHLEIYVDVGVKRPKFFIKCFGKNGVFVDGIFLRKGDEAMQLPHMYIHNTCFFHDM